MNWKTGIFVAVICASFACVCETTQAQGTGYYPYVIARGADRQRIRSMPIEMRPNRPLHFYGNAVRRRYFGRPALSQPPVRRIFQPAFPQAAPARLGQGIRFSPIFRR